MDADFWQERWHNNEIGFHQASTHALLARHWPRLGVSGSSPVLVPLCGKSLDMRWLRESGHPVTGVELVEDALAQFVLENGLPVARTAAGYAGDGWNLIAGDWFEVTLPEAVPAFYDRAALVAMPPPMRPGYVEKLLSLLAPGATGLLLTLEYDQAEMDGPPFPVLAGEVRELFAGAAEARELERLDVLGEEPVFVERGVTALQEVAWRIRA